MGRIFIKSSRDEHARANTYVAQKRPGSNSNTLCASTWASTSLPAPKREQEKLEKEKKEKEKLEKEKLEKEKREQERLLYNEHIKALKQKHNFTVSHI